MTEHLESSCELLVLTCRATRAASVNASLTPRFRIAEHSIPRGKSEIHLPAFGKTKHMSVPLEHTEISQRTDTPRHLQALIILNHIPHGSGGIDTRSIIRSGVVIIILFLLFFAQIALQCTEHDLDTGTVLVDFLDPFRAHVLE